MMVCCVFLSLHFLCLIHSFCHRGSNGSLRSCDAILKRVEANDPVLTELVILPMKTFGPSDVDRLSIAIGEIRERLLLYFFTIVLFTLVYISNLCNFFGFIDNNNNKQRVG
jgi:hypothetical protein